MIAGEIINPMIPPLKTTDSIRRALNWMEEFRVDRLPVVENKLYLGLISEDTILEKNDEQALVSDFELDYTDVFAEENIHIYDVMKKANDNDIPLIAVLSYESEFMGVITVNDTFSAFTRLSSIQSPGGILVLSMEERDYSLSEISRIIEAEDTKILSVYVGDDTLDPLKIKVTLKLNKPDLSRIISGLERFNYKIIARFQETELENTDKERLEGLMKYLNI